ncbi:MAG: autotransporter domain-containing protein [Puniceicoccales bacterium]|jgi:autotransporter-associated beta strand protein|nr:autotransporter domain-containing protein [Puniceicoccales bacterium]
MRIPKSSLIAAAAGLAFLPGNSPAVTINELQVYTATPEKYYYGGAYSSSTSYSAAVMLDRDSGTGTSTITLDRGKPLLNDDGKYTYKGEVINPTGNPDNTYTYTITNLSGVPGVGVTVLYSDYDSVTSSTGFIVVDKGVTLILNNELNTTYGGHFLSAGDHIGTAQNSGRSKAEAPALGYTDGEIVKKGKGEFQYDGFALTMTDPGFEIAIAPDHIVRNFYNNWTGTVKVASELYWSQSAERFVGPTYYFSLDTRYESMYVGGAIPDDPSNPIYYAYRGQYISNVVGTYGLPPFQLGDEFRARYMQGSEVYRLDVLEHQAEIGSTEDNARLMSYDWDEAYGAFSGTFRISEGGFIVKGYINQWREFPTPYIDGEWSTQSKDYGAGTHRMVGASRTILEGNAYLTFQNSELNIVNAEVSWDHLQNGPTRPRALRLNFVKNLMAGEDHDQFQTKVLTGLSDEYRIVAHIEKTTDIDTAWTPATIDGSMGILQGKGRFYKTGSGNFLILNEATFDGELYLAGGRTILGEETGSHNLLDRIKSVNLVGVDGGRGKYMNAGLNAVRVSPPNDWMAISLGVFGVDGAFAFEMKMAYVPDPETSSDTAQLVIRSDQVIRNLQSRFAEDSAPADVLGTMTSAFIQARDVDNPHEPYIAGTGVGTNIQLGDSVLTVIQDANGVYQGDFNRDLPRDESLPVEQLPKAGTLVKRGPATLVLMPATIARHERVVVEEGTLISNVQGLGTSRVEIKSGTLEVLQNNTGTLYASFAGSDIARLVLTTIGHVTNKSEVPILLGDANVGTIFVTQDQPDYWGNVILTAGVTVQLGSPSGDSFKNVNTFRMERADPDNELTKWASSRITTLLTNRTDQIIRNFSGDEFSRLRINAGVLTLIQELDFRFDGNISETGTLVKEGMGNFTVTGASDYSGATVVKDGQLNIVGANRIAMTSALIIKGEAQVVFTGDQTVGALFGEDEAILDIGTSKLTVGFTDAHYDKLARTPNLSHSSYFATLTNSLKNPGGINDAVKAPLALNGIVREQNLTTVALLNSGLAELSNAGELAYAGTIVGSGDIVKIGKERLTFSGVSNAYTGAVQLQQGVLRIEANSFNLAKGISIDTAKDSTANFLEVRAGAGAHLSGQTPIGGSGDLHKIGAGEASMTGQLTYGGNTIVEQGRLRITNVDTWAAAVAIPSAGKTFINNSGTLVLDWSGEEPVVYNKPIEGTGGIEKMGTGKVELTARQYRGHDETQLTAKNLKAFAYPLPAGTCWNEATGEVEFPAGSRLYHDGTVELPDGTFYKPQNIQGLDEVIHPDGDRSSVLAKPVGLLVVKADGTLVPLAASVQATGGDSKLRGSGVVVEADGTRLNTHSSVIERGNDWTYVWDDGVLVPTNVGIFIDNEGLLVEQRADADGSPYEWFSTDQNTLVLRADGSLWSVTNGTTAVFGGELRVNNALDMDYAPGDYEIGPNGTLSFNADIGISQSLKGTIFGEGVFNKTGRDELVLAVSHPEFKGTFHLDQGSVTLSATNVLTASREVTLASDTVLNLRGNDQLFHFLASDDGASIFVDGAALTLDVPSNQGESRSFRGRLLNGGELTKTGEGLLTLWRPTGGAPNQLDAINILGGVLQAAPVALANADVFVQEGAELRFYTEVSDGVQEYSGSLRGVGVIGKIGGGTVHLTGSGSLLNIPSGGDATQFFVHEGRLIVDDTRIVASQVPSAILKTAGIFQLNLTTTTDLVLGQNYIRDYVNPSNPSEQHHGSFAISGIKGTRITIDGSPLGYTGLTELLGGLELHLDSTAFANSFAVLGGGLAGTTSAFEQLAPGQSHSHPTVFLGDVVTAGMGGSARGLEINQLFDGVFEGDIVGFSSGRLADGSYGAGSKLVIKGPAKLSYRGSDGKGILPEGKIGETYGENALNADARGVGDVCIDGGRFEVGVANKHAIDVINNGTLYIYSNQSEDQFYRGRVTNSTGDSSLHVRAWAAGTGVISFDSDAFQELVAAGTHLDSLGVEHGTLRLSVNAGWTSSAHGERNPVDLLGTIPVRELYTDATLEIQVSPVADPLAYAALSATISGNGVLRKTGAGTLAINAAQQYTGDTVIDAGMLKGDFSTAGRLLNNSVFAPGDSLGEVTINGDFLQGVRGVLEIEIEQQQDGSARSDRVRVGGRVSLNGTIKIAPLNTNPARGGVLTFLTGLPNGNGGVSLPDVTYGSSLRLEFPDSNVNYILVGPGIGVGTAYEQYAGAGVSLLVAQKELGKVFEVYGYKPHAGQKTFLPVLDAAATLPVPPQVSGVADSGAEFAAWYGANASLFASLSKLPAPEARQRFADAARSLPLLPDAAPLDVAQRAVYDWLKASYLIGSHLNTAAEDKLAQVVNAYSALGYSSLVAMSAATASTSVEQLHERMEQRRYDRGVFSEPYSWQAYVVGTGNFVSNGGGVSDAPYDFNTQGGIVGVDNLISEDMLIGGAVEYGHGKATLADGGGSTQMDAVRATAYLSQALGSWFYLDAGLSFSYASYDAKRQTATGRNSASPTGWAFGSFINFGTVLSPIHSPRLFVLPHMGLEYNHHGINAFSEGGSASRLRTDSFGFDSLRAKIGTGISWLIDTAGDWSWKVNLDIAYARELLDTESDITSRFVLDPLGTSQNTVNSRTLSKDVVQLSPSVTCELSASSSVSASYRYETSFDGTTRHNVSVGYRRRF